MYCLVNRIYFQIWASRGMTQTNYDYIKNIKQRTDYSTVKIHVWLFGSLFIYVLYLYRVLHNIYIYTNNAINIYKIREWQKWLLVVNNPRYNLPLSTFLFPCKLFLFELCLYLKLPFISSASTFSGIVKCVWGHGKRLDSLTYSKRTWFFSRNVAI